MTVREKFTLGDLGSVESSPYAVRAAFAELYGEEPDGIAVNDETYFAAVRPPITVTYGHPCLKRLGEFSYHQADEGSDRSVVIGENVALNNSDQPAKIEIRLEGRYTNSVTVSSSVEAGVALSTEIGIEGAFKVGGQFSVTTTLGKETRTENTLVTTSAVTVDVPPHSRKPVRMVALMKEETVDFSVPLQVAGHFGANWSRPVNGHYFWFEPVGKLLPRTDGLAKGTVRGVHKMQVQTEIGAAQPL
ncbi:ETX/MTX2 family pore-forming toxin [Streptomyces sp. NPDC048506]|uniref:ETX/MTX2 family pore-forming toxin n=1 Tax=Streptomyces sp. NPDC048506 TaxID=3155028 RepID=UPI003428360C